MSGLASRFKLPEPEHEETPEELRERLLASEDALADYVAETYGIELPRHAVCPNHVSPAAILYALVSRKHRSLGVIGPRAGGKTLVIALSQVLSAKLFPGVAMLCIGAVEAQARRAYEHVRQLLSKESGTNVEAHPEIAESVRRRTLWRNCSSLEVVAATPKSVNGPHGAGPIAFDEIDQAPLNVWTESRGIAQSQPGIAEGAVDCFFSSRKSPTGLLQSLIDESANALKDGVQPAHHILTFCVFEVAANVPDCGNGCGCDKIIKGERCFQDVCAGKLKRAQGWLPLADIWGRFQAADQNFFDSQVLCLKPDLSGAVFPTFSRTKHTIRGWRPLPEYGPVHMGFDPGGANPFSVLWLQLVQTDVEFQPDPLVPRRLIPAGSVVAFEEIYRANCPVEEVAHMAWTRELTLQERYEGFRVSGRHYDSQGRTAMQTFMNAHPFIPYMKNFVSKNIERDIDMLRSLIEDGLLLIDIGRAPMLVNELEAYRYPDERTNARKSEVPLDVFNHSIASLRYALSNARHIARKQGRYVGKPSDGRASHGMSRPGHSRSPFLSGQSPYATHGAKDAPDVAIRDLREESLFQG